MRPRFHTATHDHSNKISSLLPRQGRYWLPLLEDISQSNAFQDQLGLMEFSKEGLYISADAMLNLRTKLTGQESHESQKTFETLRHLDNFSHSFSQNFTHTDHCPSKASNTLASTSTKSLAPSGTVVLKCKPGTSPHRAICSFRTLLLGLRRVDREKAAVNVHHLSFGGPG